MNRIKVLMKNIKIIHDYLKNSGFQENGSKLPNLVGINKMMELIVLLFQLFIQKYQEKK